MDTPALRILASTNNARGDLFTRLAKDLFFALGYDDLRLNVHKSGREIDVRGVHRFEERDVVAECKAHDEPIGGRDTNTFLGVLTRERDKAESRPISGYFISLSGFRETGIEQELETTSKNRLILLDGSKVVEELERAHLIVSREEAIHRGGRCVEQTATNGVDFEGLELLGHELGYLWAVFYSTGKQRSHFALVHADGTPLAASVTDAVMKADKQCGGTLHKLTYLVPSPSAADRVAVGKAAVERYRRWIGEECGFIQLDGLPADTDLSATRMKLERLFVPLKVIATIRKPKRKQKKTETEQTITVGDFLQTRHHVAVVAKPGGGKSTLLKRLATAYAIPARRTQSDDSLPDRKWLPLFLRCRELRDRIQRPILELLDDLPQHAGMNDEESAVFRDRMHEALRSGDVILLVDGLDEIADEGARQTFAQHLRTLIAMFPHAALVVTSREAGFRLVAGVVASICDQVRLASFDKEDVQRLCEAWHVEVVADNAKVRSDARELANTIWNNERIRALAENPLMLTTLLVVKRSIGDLPTRRVELYKEAVRVLIRTWNTEGFVPMDLDEALAQLSYVACSMTEAGQQQITHKSLLKLLQQARRELAAELQFTRISAAEFIERIEYRSSLLMQTGHLPVGGELQPVYEFRHLTFQEYLAARGLVEEQYPGRDNGQSLADLLEPHFDDETWREIIPLAAVLAGRKAEQIIQRLTKACESTPRNWRVRPPEIPPAFTLLRQCLLDEVQLAPQTLRAALQQIARHGNDQHRGRSVANIRHGKFGPLLHEIVERSYFCGSDDWDEYYLAIRDLAVSKFPMPTNALSAENNNVLVQLLKSVSRVEQTCAAMVCMHLAWEQGSRRIANSEQVEELRGILATFLDLCDEPRALAAAWALAWIGSLSNIRPSEPEMLISLYRLWRDSTSWRVTRFAAWAFRTQPLLPRDTFDVEAWGDCDTWFDNRAADADDAGAPLVLAWYRRRPWDDTELATRIDRVARAKYDRAFRIRLAEILATLGDAGSDVLEAWRRASVFQRVRP